nr:protein aveugle isoform X2 [Drosophila takahashii]
MGEETSNSTQNKTRTKTTRPKAVYQWTVSDVQKWYRRHCGEYTQYEQLFAQEFRHLRTSKH